MSCFRYMRAVNRGDAQDYDATLNMARRADLSGVNGVAARFEERPHQFVLALTPVLQWP